MCAWCPEARGGCWNLQELELYDEPFCGCCKLNLCLLEEQQLLLTAKPSFWLPNYLSVCLSIYLPTYIYCFFKIEFHSIALAVLKLDQAGLHLKHYLAQTFLFKNKKDVKLGTHKLVGLVYIK